MGKNESSEFIELNLKKILQYYTLNALKQLIQDMKEI